MYEYKATVNKVVDADTLDVTIQLGFHIAIQHRVRLLGVDAWETKEIRGADLEEVKKGKEFKAIVQRLVEGKEIIMATTKDEEDKYGRFLAEVTINEGDNKGMVLNDYLLSIGADRNGRKH